MTLRGHERSLARVALLIVNDGRKTVNEAIYPEASVSGVKPSSPSPTRPERN